MSYITHCAMQVLWNGEGLDSNLLVASDRVILCLHTFLRYAWNISLVSFILKLPRIDGSLLSYVISRHICFMRMMLSYLMRLLWIILAYIISMPKKFGKTSGLDINILKSRLIFPKSLNPRPRRILSHSIHIPTSTSFRKYHGAPLGTHKPKMKVLIEFSVMCTGFCRSLG